jgi:hypothetical protein
MWREFLNVLEGIGVIAIVIGFIWLRIKTAEPYHKGLDRKSSIQTLFGDEDK